MLEYLEWNHANGKDIEYYERLVEIGKATPLDTRPELCAEGWAMWEVYCYTMSADHLLINLDIYARQVGLPPGWMFDECLETVAAMTRLYFDLVNRDMKNKAAQNG